MTYNILEKTIYLKSRYELTLLLNEIYSPEKNIPLNSFAFNQLANEYEKQLDQFTQGIPYSEERLALFLHIYSNAGLLSAHLQKALTTNNRSLIYVALRYVNGDSNSVHQQKKKRCFYEAEIFGLMDYVCEIDKKKAYGNRINEKSVEVLRAKK